jgi:class 3 adenylate cyclase/tetratricopeptide (TPR) repeat protein
VRAYTPKYLAERILVSRAALEGERKHVTVLFADVKGSMELAEQFDPEEWHRILDRFFQLLADGVHRFEGTVNQYTGDGIMALFGAPIAHEDHAQRACWAALHLRDELRRYSQELRREHGLDFAVRIGLNSGEVVVGRIGDDLRMDYTAQGHTVGLAARMEQLAEAGKIYVTEHTAALVAGLFRLEDLGRFSVKGAHEALRVHELSGIGPLRSRLEVARARGFSSFVGREQETAALEAALARALGGNGQVVGVVAEPGVGKSRLCYEFAARCRARGLPVDQAHGVAHGKGIPFLPVLEYLRGLFGITDHDGEQAAREKIAGKLLLLDPEFAASLPLLFDFLGVPDPERPAPRMDPEARQRQLFAAMKRLTHARSRREPGLTVLEDLHWIDGGSEAFLENFVDAVAGTRTLVVVNFRPEYHATWMQRSYYQQLPLLPLGPEASAALLRHLLGADPSLRDLPERIGRRTGGNPFFIEEVVQGLVETEHLDGTRGAYRLAKPVGEETLPATVQVILAARIDRLGEREKAVLQTAAVIGKEFPEPILRRVSELAEPDLVAALAALTRAELLYEEALYPEAEYAFKHPLTQEVAYRSQLAERRASVHGAVARTIADIYPDKLDEKAAALAYHWEGAGEALEAARWHRRAAEWAGMSDAREALRHWQQVRALLDPLPESPECCDLGLWARLGILNFGWRFSISVEEAAALLAEGRALAARADDRGLLTRLLLVYSTLRGFAGDLDEYEPRIEEGAALADLGGDIALRVAARMGFAYMHYTAGRLREALVFVDEGLELSRPDPRAGTDVYGFAPGAFLLHLRGAVLLEMGRLVESAHELERAAELARALAAPENLGWIAGDRASLEGFRGDGQAALEHAALAVQLAETIGTSFSRYIAHMQLGDVHVEAARWHDAVESLEPALALARDSRTGVILESLILARLSRAYLGVGARERARATAEEAVAAGERRGSRVYAIDAHLALAHALLRTEGAAGRPAIERALAQATALIEATGARKREPLVHLERAELARLAGDEATRLAEIAAARRLFDAMGAPARAAALAEEPGA